MLQVLWFVRIWALLMMALRLAANYLPEEMVWGLYPFTYWPTWLQLTMAGAGCALCIGPVNRWLRRALRWLLDRWPAPGKRRWWFAGCGLLMALPFWLGRIVHTRWGDAYILSRAISHSEVRLTFTWQAPFDVFLHAKAWEVANRLWGWDVIQVYHVLSPLTGVVFLFLLLCMADDLGRDRVEKATLAGMIASLGLMQFFFGYIENYVFVTVGIVGYLWLGVRQAEGKADLTWPSLTLAFSNAFHPSTILGLQTSMIWLWLREVIRPLPDRWAHIGKSTLKAGLPMLAVFALVVLMMELGGHGLGALTDHDAPGGGDGKWFVPLTTIETKWERYTMLSPAHLLELANQQLLVAPFSLALILALLASRRGREAIRSPGSIFLAIAAANYLWFIIVWNPDYGGQRDWDLFAPASLPITFLAATWLIRTARVVRERGEKSRLGEISLIVVGMTLIFSAAWIYSNTIPWDWETGHLID